MNPSDRSRPAPDSLSRWRSATSAAALALVLMGGAGAAEVAPAAPVRHPPPPSWEPAQALRAAAEDFVRSHLPAGSGRARVRLRAQLPAARFRRCAPGQLVAQAFGDANPYGAQTVQLRCRGPQAWSVYLPVRVDWPQQVVVAAHALAAGHALRASDLQVLQRNRDALPPGSLHSEAQAEGRVLTVGVAAGQGITRGMLAGRTLIHNGQSVALIAEGQGIRLVALGVALQDGSRGQTVLVRNAQSGRVVSGVVDRRGDVIAARMR